MAQKKLSQYLNASSIASTLRLVALQGTPAENVNIPISVLEDYIEEIISTSNGPAHWLTGSGAPANGTGSDGDFYFRGTTGEIYGPKAAGAWGSSIANITGPEGTVGDDGPAGAPGSMWWTGAGAPSNGSGSNGDFYLRTSNGDVYGPKAAGVWGSVVGNLKGPQGDAGAGGAAEYAWVTRPTSGNTDGDRIVITDVGSVPQTWVWKTSRWLPELGRVFWKFDAPFALADNTSYQYPVVIDVPMGLLAVGSVIRTDLSLSADQGGLDTPSNVGAPTNWEYGSYIDDNASDTRKYIDQRGNIQNVTMFVTSGRVIIVSPTKAWGDPYQLVEQTIASSTQVSTIDISHQLSIKLELKKQNATELIQVLEYRVEIYP